MCTIDRAKMLGFTGTMVTSNRTGSSVLQEQLYVVYTRLHKSRTATRADSNA